SRDWSSDVCSSDLLDFCSSLPPRMIAEAASVDAISGLAVSVLPSSSTIRPTDIQPKSLPPCSSGMMTPVQPISDIALYASGLNASGAPLARTLRNSATGLSLVDHSRAISRSISCSSFRTAIISSLILFVLEHSKHALGDHAVLDFG